MRKSTAAALCGAMLALLPDASSDARLSALNSRGGSDYCAACEQSVAIATCSECTNGAVISWQCLNTNPNGTAWACEPSTLCVQGSLGNHLSCGGVFVWYLGMNCPNNAVAGVAPCTAKYSNAVDLQGFGDCANHTCTVPGNPPPN